MHSIQFPMDASPDFFALLEAGLGADRPLRFWERRALEMRYQRYGECAGFGLAPSAAFKGSSGTAIKNAYKQTYAGGCLEEFRKALRKAAKGRCPSCGRTDPDELDHYLPSSKFAEFALFPLNLVPLCGGCNRKKLARVATEKEDAFIHPYFDDIPNVALHLVQFQEMGGSMVAKFSFASDGIGDAALAVRMAKQFELVDVNYQISFEVETTIREIVDVLNDEFVEAQPEEVSAYLTRTAERKAASFNKGYWKVALYQSLANDDAFCAGGWKGLAAA